MSFSPQSKEIVCENGGMVTASRQVRHEKKPSGVDTPVILLKLTVNGLL